jgi:hypothetical protein
MTTLLGILTTAGRENNNNIKSGKIPKKSCG